jgi:hypothetical protein
MSRLGATADDDGPFVRRNPDRLTSTGVVDVTKLFVSALLVTTALAQQPTLAKPPPSRVELSGHNAIGKPSRTPKRPISMPFELRNNLIVMNTTVNGRRQRAVLDSGSGGLIVDQTFARKSGLVEGDVLGHAAGGGEQAQQLRPVVVPKLTVGPLRFKNLGGYSMSLSQLSASKKIGFRIDLIVGAPAFKYGMVAVDYARHRVTFGPSASGPACAAPIPLTIVNNVPVVEVRMRPTPDAAPIPLKLVVDLGTLNNAVMLGGPFVRSEAGKALIRSGVPQQVGHGTGGKVQGAVARIAEFQIGASQTSNLEVALTSGVAAFEAGFVDGSLGVPFWQGGVITFDYQAGALCIET